MKPQISLCIPFHNNHSMLAHQRVEWARLPQWVEKSIEIVLVDDASETPIKSEGERVFRIDPPHVPWSHRCATNIAAHEARGDWLLLTDIDHVVPNETLQELIGMTRCFDKQLVYYFSRRDARGRPIKHHPDSWLFHRDTWARIGGWDERYRGLYGQNARHWDRVRHFCGEPVLLPLELVLIESAQIADASSPADYYKERAEQKVQIHALRRQFRNDGTYFASHQLTVPYRAIES